MRTLFIATASALFFAYAITELTTRLWPENYLALLIVAFVALLVSGLLNLRLAAPGAAPAPVERAPQSRQQARQPRRQNQRQRERDAPADDARSRNDAAAPKRDAPPRRETPPDGPRETGTVKWFNRTKGFGFVIRESGEEIFVHQRSIRSIGEGDERRRPGLRDGQTVTFVVAEREKGLQAEDVVPAEDA
ncbi:MAG: cold shock domain-containing protein [Pseudomonadales bacterium]